MPSTSRARTLSSLTAVALGAALAGCPEPVAPLDAGTSDALTLVHDAPSLLEDARATDATTLGLDAAAPADAAVGEMPDAALLVDDAGAAESDAAAADAWAGSDAFAPYVPPPDPVYPALDPVPSTERACDDAFGGPGAPATAVATVLAACPRIRAAISWTEPDGSRVGYDAWPGAWRARVQALYSQLLAGGPLDVDCPDPDAQMVRSDPTLAVYPLWIPAAQAHDLHALRVAYTLYVDATRAVPWRLASATDGELRELLDASTVVQHLVPGRLGPSGMAHPTGIGDDDYVLPPRNHATPSYVCDPRPGLRYLTGRSSEGTVLLAPTPRETIVRMTAWLADEVGHGACRDTDATALDCRVGVYAYELVDRLASVRDRLIAPQGCHSAANLFYDLARSANLPLLVVKSEEDVSWARPAGSFLNNTHEGLVFDFDRAEPRILLHADDVYANGLMSFVPVGDDGHLVSDAWRAERLFETTWATADDWERMGFVIDRSFAPLDTSIAHPRAPYNSFEILPDLGRYAGGAAPIGAATAMDSGFSYGRAHRDLALCGTWWLVKPYCDASPEARADFTSHLRAEYPALDLGASLLDGYTPSTARDRLDRCVSAWDSTPGAGDGCARFQAHYDAWVADPPSTYVP
ncbi:MAG: hypothetical protein U0353_32740 [Sandaracinus sp.]